MPVRTRRTRTTTRNRGRPTLIAGDPTRLIVHKQTKRVVGHLMSVKNDGLVPWESQLERDHLRILETDNNVVSYRVQPDPIVYVLGGKQRRYTPDVEVRYANGDIHIVEVKYLDDALHPDNQRAFQIFRKKCEEANKTYRVVTEVTIRQQSNIECITRYLYLRDHQPSPVLAHRVREIFQFEPPSTLGELEDKLGFTEDTRYQLLAMAVRGHFSLDVNQTARRDTPIFPSPIDGRH